MARTRIVTNPSYSNTQVLVMENSSLIVKLIPEKGSDIVEIQDKNRKLSLLYRSPIGFHRFGSLSPPLGTEDSAFTDYYEGGWQDILPNPGLASSYKGARWGLHGESALLPWRAQIIDDHDVAKVRLSTNLVRFPFRLEKCLSLRKDESVLRIEWNVENLGEQDIDFAWVQHIVFGRPIVGPGMKIDMKAGECSAGEYRQTRLKAGESFKWPKAPALDGSSIDMSREPDSSKRFEDQLYVKMEEPWYAIRNAKLDLTIGVSWDRRVFPYLWYWLNNGALDYPWWGRSYNLGLEPSSSLTEHGMEEYLERGNVLHLAEGKSLKARASFSVKAGAERVRSVDPSGKIVT